MKLRLEEAYLDNNKIIELTDGVVAYAEVYSVQGAQEIIRRVNAHDALVEALKAAAFHLSHEYDEQTATMKKIRAALALAEKGEGL